MIPRYSRPEMTALWSDQAKLKRWLDVELWASEAMAEAGLCPKEVPLRLSQKMRGLDLAAMTARVDALEQMTGHDVIAFLSYLEEQLGDDARYVHLGLTSSDVVDTALAMAMRDALTMIMEAQEKYIRALDERARAHAGLTCLGRSHGQAAEPMSFGVKMALHAAGARRDLQRLKRAREVISVGKLSGAVGTFTQLPPEVEAAVMRKAGLRAEPVASQVVQRDRHAEVFALLALSGASLERLAVELRHLARTEVGEAMEPFGRGQKGSSAMPHKRNPILCENITGLSRLLRGYASAALEDVALWHERDISHSAVERVIGPDATTALHFAIHRMIRVLEGLQVQPEAMARNLRNAGDVIYSQKLLILLTRKGAPRQEAYEHVQKAAQGGSDFLSALCADPFITGLIPEAELRAVCTSAPYLSATALLLERSQRGD